MHTQLLMMESFCICSCKIINVYFRLLAVTDRGTGWITREAPFRPGQSELCRLLEVCGPWILAKAPGETGNHQEHKQNQWHLSPWHRCHPTVSQLPQVEPRQVCAVFYSKENIGKLTSTFEKSTFLINTFMALYFFFFKECPPSTILHTLIVCICFIYLD